MNTSRHILLGTTLSVGLLGAFTAGFFLFVHNDLYLDFSRLAYYNPGRPSILLDDAGQEWARFQLDKREPILLEALPAHLIQAFVAAEDWYFFSHHGISYKGIIRSIWVNLYYGSKKQGASTITQQLVKLLFLDSAKTFTRKIQEQMYAVLIEQHFTKQQIIQTYLNHIYFGCGIYGVEAASQRFWNISASELSVEQAAVLAGIVSSPGRYCPLLYPLSCQKRRNIVLYSMHKLGFLSDKQLEDTRAQVLTIVPEGAGCCAPHVRESLRVKLEKQLGKAALYTGGFTIYTTLNRAMQDAAQTIFTTHCSQLKQSIMPEIDGALLCVERTTGHVKALVGGYDFSISKFNRALDAHRQAGSTIKPLIYAVAMDQGGSFADTQMDEPFELVQANSVWRPKNYNKKFNGQMTLALALSYSSNIVAIKTLLAVGAHSVVHLLKECGITQGLHEYPSLALGCIDTTLDKIVGMFNIFANDGVFVEPSLLLCIKDRDGKKIWRSESITKRILSSKIVGRVTFILQYSLQRMYQFFPGKNLPCQAISKTGTTNDSRTCWYVGSTPDYTTAVVIGCDDNRPMGKHVYPVITALPIWLDFQHVVPHKQKQFEYDPSLRSVVINSRTGQKTTVKDPDAMTILV